MGEVRNIDASRVADANLTEPDEQVSQAVSDDPREVMARINAAARDGHELLLTNAQLENLNDVVQYQAGFVASYYSLVEWASLTRKGRRFLKRLGRMWGEWMGHLQKSRPGATDEESS